MPVIGEITLRLRSRTLGKVTVPRMFTDSGEVIGDSLDIARFAERNGTGSPLFPKGHEDAIVSFNELSERLIELGRVRYMDALAHDRDLQLENLPPFLPSMLQGPSAPVAILGGRWIAHKYQANKIKPADADADRAQILANLEDVLADGRQYLVDGAFTYADISIATALNTIEPETTGAFRIGPATRRAWTSPDLARRYRRLLDWRDGIYTAHRRR